MGDIVQIQDYERSRSRATYRIKVLITISTVAYLQKVRDEYDRLNGNNVSDQLIEIINKYW